MVRSGDHRLEAGGTLRDAAWKAAPPCDTTGMLLRTMRVRNREIRARRKRKDETIKAAHKALAAQYANKPAPKKPAPKK